MTDRTRSRSGSVGRGAAASGVPPALDGPCAGCQGEKRSSSASGLRVSLTVADWTRCFSIVMGSPPRSQACSSFDAHARRSGQCVISLTRASCIDCQAPAEPVDLVPVGVTTVMGSSPASGHLWARLTTHATKDPTLCTSSSIARSPAKRRDGGMPEPASYQLSRHRRAEALTPRSRQGAIQRTIDQV